jgi:hypothetical protein
MLVWYKGCNIDKGGPSRGLVWRQYRSLHHVKHACVESCGVL